MKSRCLVLLLLCLSRVSFSNAQCTGNNLLLNPGFDDIPMGDYGNNFVYDDFDPWTFAGAWGNIVKLDGNYSESNPDSAKNGDQFLDMVGSAGIAYQYFTMTGGTPTPITFGGYFSSRETSPTYINWTASIQIFALPSGTVVGTSTVRLFTVADAAYPARNNWYLVYGSVTLPPGNYAYLVNLGDFGNFDAAFVGVDCPVPVVLKSFDVQNVNDKAKLTWDMADQSGVSTYEIEKSVDAIHFSSVKQIGVTPATEYKFTDEGIPTTSFAYYRIKITGTSNKITYSKIIRVSFNHTNYFEITPNPASNLITLNGIKKQGWVSVSDLSGKRVLRKLLNPQQPELNISSLLPGLYFLSYTEGSAIQTRQFIKQ